MFAESVVPGMEGSPAATRRVRAAMMQVGNTAALHMGSMQRNGVLQNSFQSSASLLSQLLGCDAGTTVREQFIRSGGLAILRARMLSTVWVHAAPLRFSRLHGGGCTCTPGSSHRIGLLRVLLAAIGRDEPLSGWIGWRCRAAGCSRLELAGMAWMERRAVESGLQGKLQDARIEPVGAAASGTSEQADYASEPDDILWSVQSQMSPLPLACGPGSNYPPSVLPTRMELHTARSAVSEGSAKRAHVVSTPTILAAEAIRQVSMHGDKGHESASGGSTWTQAAETVEAAVRKRAPGARMLPTTAELNGAVPDREQPDLPGLALRAVRAEGARWWDA